MEMTTVVIMKYMLMLIVYHETASYVYDMSSGITTETDESVLKYTNCSQPWCEAYSPSEVIEIFSGLFLSKEQVENQTMTFRGVRKHFLQEEGIKDVADVMNKPGDGDSCCISIVTARIETSLDNLDGVSRPIVHMPPKYQFIPEASCGDPGLCEGKCVLEPVTVTLLIYDHTAQSLMFDHFPVPGYCSCKRDCS